MHFYNGVILKRPFTFYIIQSAHTDIGYTHPQDQIKDLYLEHYDRVLELCAKDLGRTEASRFKWTCETSWQVKHYLEHRPERLEEFVACVRRGQIELTANYLHFTDLIDADALKASFGWIVGFCREHGLALKSAMHCDINGWPWALADVLHELGVENFLTQTHIEHGTDPLGKRGGAHQMWKLDGGNHSLLSDNAPLRVPQAFQWAGPNGGQVLTWIGEHYLLGNFLGLSGDKMFGTDKTRYFIETDHRSVEQLLSVATKAVPDYLKRLRAEGYGLEIGLLSTGGYLVDNAPPDTRWCHVIEQLNAAQDEIVFRTATVGEWFDALRQHSPPPLPTHGVAWPDHWAHGLGSMTTRIAQARRTQRRRNDAKALVARSNSSRAAELLEQSFEQELLSLEHTFGAWSTALKPAAMQNSFQQSVKEAMFHRAELHLEDAVGIALRALIPAPTDLPALHAFLPAAGERCTVHFAAGDLELQPDTQALRSTDGTLHAFQLDDPQQSSFVSTVTAPAVDRLSSLSLVSHQTQPVRSSVAATLRLESAAWRLQLNPDSGGLLDLRDRSSDRQWVDSEAALDFGQWSHEVVVHSEGRNAVGNLARFVALDVGTPKAHERMGNHPIFARSSPQATSGVRLIEGPVFDALEWYGTLNGGELIQSWRLYHDTGLLELVVDWDKPWSDLPEAAHVAFPFAAAGGSVQLETAGGLFKPGCHGAGGQLPGTVSSYYTVQRAARVIGRDGAELLWLPLDAPLVMTQALDYNRWETDPYVWNGFLASMPVNHYWWTNFPTSQRGPLRLRYRLMSPGGADVESALHIASPVEALGWR